MRLTGFLVVVSTAAALLGWYRPFEAACGLAVLVVFGAVWILPRRTRRTGGDEDEIYDAESPRFRELVLGILVGVAWLCLASLAIRGLAATRVHGWFVDDPGQALASELELLARNGAWSNILARLNRPLPAEIGRLARGRIDRLHYMALTHSAAAIADSALRCTAQREALTFADANSIDPLDRTPFTCPPPGAPGEAIANARLRILKQEQDPAGRTVVTVAVVGPSGAPPTRLDQGSFLALAGGREVTIANVAYAPTVSPPRRFAVVVGPLRSRAYATAAPVACGIVSGLIRATDHVETLTCCSIDGALAATLARAVDSIRTQPGALILLTEGGDPFTEESTSALLRDLRAIRSPLHLLVFGKGGAGMARLESVAHDSGGRRVNVPADNVPSIRNLLAEPLAWEGVYFVALDGSYRKASIALAATRPEVAK